MHQYIFRVSLSCFTNAMMALQPDWWMLSSCKWWEEKIPSFFQSSRLKNRPNFAYVRPVMICRLNTACVQTLRCSNFVGGVCKKQRLKGPDNANIDVWFYVDWWISHCGHLSTSRSKMYMQNCFGRHLTSASAWNNMEAVTVMCLIQDTELVSCIAWVYGDL